MRRVPEIFFFLLFYDQDVRSAQFHGVSPRISFAKKEVRQRKRSRRSQLKMLHATSNAAHRRCTSVVLESASHVHLFRKTTQRLSSSITGRCTALHSNTLRINTFCIQHIFLITEDIEEEFHDVTYNYKNSVVANFVFGE